MSTANLSHYFFPDFFSLMSKTHGLFETVAYIYFFTLFQVYNDIMAFPGPLCEAADIKVKLTYILML